MWPVKRLLSWPRWPCQSKEFARNVGNLLVRPGAKIRREFFSVVIYLGARAYTTRHGFSHHKCLSHPNGIFRACGFDCPHCPCGLYAKMLLCDIYLMSTAIARRPMRVQFVPIWPGRWSSHCPNWFIISLSFMWAWAWWPYFISFAIPFSLSFLSYAYLIGCVAF